MSRTRAILLLALVILTAMLLLWRDGARHEPAGENALPAAARPDVVALSAPESAPELGREAVVGAAPAAAVEPSVAVTPWPPEDRTRLYFRGRCVAAESGAPLAGCTVEFRGHAGNRELIARHGEPDWKQPDPVITGADGRFQFEVPETLPYQFSLYCRAEGRLGRADRYDTELPGGTAYDLGDVALERGAIVTGIVRDEHGAPVAEVGVSILNLPMPIRPGQGSSDSIHAQSAADGALVYTQAIPAGTWPLRLDARTCTLEGPASVTVDASLAPVHLEVRVRHSPSIEGVVLDEHGAPAAGVTVQVIRDTSGRTESGRSDASGIFRVYRQRESQAPVRLKLSGGSLEPKEFAPLFDWGARGVSLQSRRLLQVQLLVQESGNGVPVEDFAVICHGVSAESSTQTGLRLGGKHPGGAVTIPDVAWGENLLQVVPTDPALLPNEAHAFVAPRDRDEPILIELHRMAALDVRLQTKNGDVVKDSTVGLFESALEDPNWNIHLDTRPRNGRLRLSSLRFQLRPLSYGAADEAGMVRLYAPAGLEQGTFVVEGDHPKLVEVVQRPFERGQPLVILVSRGAIIRGRLIHPLVGTHKIGVSAQGERIATFGSEPAFTDAAGNFELRGLAPGNWRICLSVMNEVNDRSGGGGGHWQEQQPPLATVSLAADEIREVLLDASAHAPSTMRARLLLPDPAWSELAVHLQRTSSGTDGRTLVAGIYGSFEADPSGNILARELPPGNYRADASWKTPDGKRRTLQSTNLLELRPGEEASGTFHFARLRLRLRLLDSSGAPLAGVGVRRIWFDPESAVMTSDADGWVELDWMSPGPNQFQLIGEPARSILPVTVDAERTLTEVEVRALTAAEWQAERARENGGG